MKFVIDTEFNDFGGELISLAVVSSSGLEWYETLGCESPTAWVAANVIPVIGDKKPLKAAEFSLSLAEFLRGFSEVCIIADWPEDVAHFCRALITGPGARVGPESISFEVRNAHYVSRIPHNALEDARALKIALGI